MKLLVVVIDYNSADEVFSYYKHLSGFLSREFEFYIACNSGTESLYAVFEPIHENVSIIDTGGNVGYFPAANIAINSYKEKNIDYPDYIIVSNTDIEVLSQHLLSTLSEIGSEHDMLAPNIVTSDGVNQNPFMTHRTSRFKLKLLEFVFSYTFSFIFYNFLSRLKVRMSRQLEIREPRYIYAPHGSFLIFKGSFFLKGGNLDFQSFLYGEEVFIAELCRQLGCKILFYPDIRILHSENACTGLLPNKNKAVYMRQSLRYLIEKFFNAS